MKQIHTGNNSMHTRNKELTQQLQTSNIEIGRLQAEASDLRNSVGRSRSTENLEQLLHCLPHRWKRIAVYSTKNSRRERSSFISIRFTLCKKNKNNRVAQESPSVVQLVGARFRKAIFGKLSQGGPCAK